MSSHMRFALKVLLWWWIYIEVAYYAITCYPYQEKAFSKKVLGDLSLFKEMWLPYLDINWKEFLAESDAIRNSCKNVRLSVVMISKPKLDDSIHADEAEMEN